MGTNIDVAEEFDNALIRIEQILFIGGMLGSWDSPSHALRDALDDDLDAIVSSIPGATHEEIEHYGEDGGGFIEWAIDTRRLGFLVQFGKPVMRGSVFSWGMYRTMWVYAETLDEAIEIAKAKLNRDEATDARQPKPRPAPRRRWSMSNAEISRAELERLRDRSAACDKAVRERDEALAQVERLREVASDIVQDAEYRAKHGGVCKCMHYAGLLREALDGKELPDAR